MSMRLMRLANKVEKTNEDEPGQLQVNDTLLIVDCNNGPLTPQ